MILKSVLLAGAALVGTALVPIQGAIAIRKNAVARFGLSKTEEFEVQNLLEKLGMVNGNDDYGNKKAITNNKFNSIAIFARIPKPL